MNTWNVLVIDDNALPKSDPNSRYDRYQKLEEEHYDGKIFKLQFADSSDCARRLLKQERFDLVLLDVRLNQWGDDSQGQLFKELFDLADKRFTVALVSSEWDNSSIQLVRGFLSSHPHIRLPLFFTFRDFEGRAFAAIATQIVSHIRQQRGQHVLDISPDESLRILHLSDLHFGSEAAKRTLASEANTSLLCDKIKAEWPESLVSPAGPHIVVVTGDIGNTGHPSDYALALLWFQKFANELGWTTPTPRILLVPGNHDFSIPLCGAKSIGLKADGSLILQNPTELSEQLCAYANEPFRAFAKCISATPRAWDKAPLASWTEFGFAEYGFAFSGFNTSKLAGNKSWPLRILDIEDISNVRRAFNSRKSLYGAEDIFHISLSHHSLIRYSGVHEEISNPDECSEHLFGEWLSPKLMLHGHEHRRWGELPSGNDYMVIAAPTPTVKDSGRPPNSPQGVNLVCLLRKDSKVTGIEAKSLIRLEDRWSVLPLPNKSGFRVN